MAIERGPGPNKSLGNPDRLNGLTLLERAVGSVIFDVDGTLSDSIDAYYEMFRRVCSGFGIEVQRKEVLEPMIIGDNIWDRTIPIHIPDREDLIKKARAEMPRVYREVISHTKIFPNVELLLKQLTSKGIKLGLLTSSWKYALMPLEQEGLLPYFSVVITKEDGYPAKPKPDGLIACLEQIDAKPSESIIVGDSPVDIKAGKATGVQTIGVMSGIADRATLAAEGPDMILNHVGDLLTVFGLDA